ncbi:MAG: toxin-antitoxin system YwqK family antitoxin [Thermonemataceae bacterium]|nr:toxin-antitoxin system YwqK family antitoxin [Thermonemataceae bacterium]
MCAYSTNYFTSSSQLESEGELDEQNRKIGQWTFYHPNGKIKQVGTYVKDLADGEFTYYNESGIISSKGFFRAGQWHGAWEWYDANGVVYQIGAYKDNLLDGDFIWYQNNKIITEGSYKKGKRNGLWLWRDAQGTLIQKSEYKDDLLDGIFETYNNDGSPKEAGFYIANQKHGEYIVWEKGKEKINLYEYGLPIMTEQEWAKIAEKIRKKKKDDYYAKRDILEKSVGWYSINAAFWHLIKNKYISINENVGFLHDLAEHTHLIKAEELVELLQEIDTRKWNSSNILPYWSYYLDKICMLLYAQEPATFDKAWRTFPKHNQKGFASVLARFGKKIPENAAKAIAVDLAKQVVKGYIGMNGSGTDGNYENIYWQENGELKEISLVDKQGYLNEYFDRFLSFFSSTEHWEKELLQQALKESYNLPVQKLKRIFQIANTDEFADLFKAVSSYDYQLYYQILFDFEPKTPENFEHIANLLKEDWRVGTKAEMAIIEAILQHKKAGTKAPTWYDEWIHLEAYYFGKDSGGKMFAGLEQQKEALLYLGNDRTKAILERILTQEYAWQKVFPLLSITDKTLWDKALNVLEKKISKDLSLYNLNPVVEGIVRLEKEDILAYLEEKIQDTPLTSPAYEVFVWAIIAKIALFAEQKTEWNEHYDQYLRLHLWKPNYGDEYDYYIAPHFEKIAQFLSPQRFEQQFLPQINSSEVTFIRCFQILTQQNSENILDKVAQELAKKQVNILNTNWIRFFLEKSSDFIKENFIRKVIMYGAKGETIKWLKESITNDKYEKILSEFQDIGVEKPQEYSLGESIAELCRVFFSENPKAASTTIYFLEPLYEQDVAENSLNRIRGKAPVAEKNIPQHQEEPMEHIFTLEVATMPLLAQRLPKETKALSLFVYNSDYNEAYSPDTEESAVRFWQENDIVAEKTEGSYSFSITELKVPTEIFYQNYESPHTNTEAIRKKVFNAPAYVLGEPIWLQGDEYEGNFLLQFDERFGDVNLGDSGVMYVFENTAFWQCY